MESVAERCPTTSFLTTSYHLAVSWTHASPYWLSFCVHRAESWTVLLSTLVLLFSVTAPWLRQPWSTLWLRSHQADWPIRTCSSERWEMSWSVS
jgi:hypothetical protein